jgi:hypothetical protein
MVRQFPAELALSCWLAAQQKERQLLRRRSLSCRKVRSLSECCLVHLTAPYRQLSPSLCRPINQCQARAIAFGPPTPTHNLRSRREIIFTSTLGFSTFPSACLTRSAFMRFSRTCPRCLRTHRTSAGSFGLPYFRPATPLRPILRRVDDDTFELSVGVTLPPRCSASGLLEGQRP